MCSNVVILGFLDVKVSEETICPAKSCQENNAWCQALHVPLYLDLCFRGLHDQFLAKSLESDRLVLLRSSWQAETEREPRASMAEFTWPASRFRNQFYTLFNWLRQWTLALWSEIEQIGWLCSFRLMPSAASHLNKPPQILNNSDLPVLMVTIMCNVGRN